MGILRREKSNDWLMPAFGKEYMDSFRELLFKTQIEALVTEREAMKAANEERYTKNQTQAYNEEAFQTLVGQFASLEEHIRYFLRNS